MTETAVHKRFTPECAQFLHAILEEMTNVVVEADRQVPLELVSRFEAVVLEDSSTVVLPNELVTCWQGWVEPLKKGTPRSNSMCVGS